MGRAVFLCYHGIGHFNACFRLAKAMQPEHDIIFAGHEYFQKYVECQGFPYYPLKSVPFGLGFESWANTRENKRSIYWSTLKDRWRNLRFNLRERELTKLLDETTPEYVFIDSSQSTDLIVLYPFVKNRRIRTLIFHAMLSPTVEPDLPPINCLRLPGESLRIAGWIFILQRLKRALGQWLKYVGRNDFYLVRKTIRQNQFPKKYLSAKPALFSLNFENVHQLIMAPVEFELPSKYRSPFQHYLGFMLDLHRKEKGDSSFYTDFAEIQQKIASGKTLLYCSFGTVETKLEQKLMVFLKNLSLALRDSSYMLLVAGNSFSVLQRLNLPGEIYYFREVPQYQVLEHAALFISHGGWNSVKEGLHAQVPLLLYPLDPRTDQPGISSRVVYHALGLRGDMKKDSPYVIRLKIDTLLGDSSYKQRISRMVQIEKTYSDERFLSVIKAIPPLD